MCSISTEDQISLAVDENCSQVLIFCPFVQNWEAKLDPITDIFRTMHVTAFGLHRLEATAPWGVNQENQAEEKVTPSGKKLPCGMAGQIAKPIQSHEVHSDGTITFRYLDTGAKHVEVSVGGLRAPVPMTNIGGVWTATTLQLNPDI